MNHETPRLGGAAWRPLFTPAKTGCYVNDHCVVRAHDGRWHVFGITKDTPEIDPHRERWFCHGAGPSLAEGGFKELGRVCDFGARAWAPAVAFDGQRWVMIYGPDRLRAAICDDPRLESWHEAPCTLTGGPPFGVMRDGMILRLDDDTWLLYATGKRGPDGAVAVCVSENLLDWRFVRFALRTTPARRQAAALGGDRVALRVRARRRVLAVADLHHERSRPRATTTTRSCSARRTRSTSASTRATRPSQPRRSRRTRRSTWSIPTRAGGTSRAPAGTASASGR